MTLAQRVALGSLVVVSALVVFIVVVADRRLRERLEDLQTEQLTRAAQLVAAQWRPGVDADSLADAVGRVLARRVTLVAPDGRVVGDTEFGGEVLARLENHAVRPEIVAARARGIGTAVRTSTSTGEEQLYVAVLAPGGRVARVSLPTEGLSTILGQAQLDVLAAGILALVLAMGLTWFFSRAVSRPIVELRNVAGAIAAGDLTRRPALAAPGEVGDLAAALHAMGEQLASRLRALQAEDALTSALFESLLEGVLAVDERRRVVRMNVAARELLGIRERVPFPVEHLPRVSALREALESALRGRAVAPTELQVEERTLLLTARPLLDGGAVLAVLDLTHTRRLETIRRDFVANVSHELRTPITVIGGFAETLLDDPELPDAQRHAFLEAIRANATRMQRIVQDLLDLSRIESGGWRPAPQSVALAEVAAELQETLGPVAAEKGVALALDPAAADRTVYADPTAVRQILHNLAENALRYTPRGGSVTIFAEPEQRGTWIGVRDTGIGVAPHHLPRIFERFYRADPGRSREAGGTGLGLSIVRHLAEAHGGRVRAESTPGRGTTVAAWFPEADAAPGEPPRSEGRGEPSGP